MTVWLSVDEDHLTIICSCPGDAFWQKHFEEREVMRTQNYLKLDQKARQGKAMKGKARQEKNWNKVQMLRRWKVRRHRRKWERERMSCSLCRKEEGWPLQGQTPCCLVQTVYTGHPQSTYTLTRTPTRKHTECTESMKLSQAHPCSDKTCWQRWKKKQNIMQDISFICA